VAYLGRQWNGGFGCPYFDRPTVSKVIADQEALLASTITPSGATTLTLAHSVRVPQQTHAA
jgi:hypothetical protein